MTTEIGHRYRDRLTARVVPAPPSSGTLVGRWVIEGDTTDVFMNSAGIAAGDFLVPEPSGHWQVLTSDGHRLNGTVARAQVPDELEAESVRTIGDKLAELSQNDASWLEWLDVVPLVPGISEQVDLQPLELMIREHFGHIEAVCRKPRAHLHVEVERVPVSRARRIPPAAASYLAAHTEDWDRPLLRGILPKRILAEVRHDQVDIYENRVAARLLDNIGAYLNRRIHVLRRLLKVFREKEDYSTAIAGTYQRERRISELWGESIDANEGRRKAEASLRELEWLKYKVMGLLGSPLYEEVPRRAFVPTTLKSTNILTNDQHYRRVAELWREWARTGAGRTRSPAELHAEAQRLCRGLDSFALLLTVRALDTLGYEPSDAALDKPLARGQTLSIRGHGAELAVEWRVDGTISVDDGDRQFTIVAITSNLAAGKADRVGESLDRIRQATAEHGEVLVQYVASDDECASAEPDMLASLHTVGNDPRSRLAGGGCLPVSPWEIGSTERVARALRWFVSSARYGDYPLEVPVPEDARGLVAPEQGTRWLASRDGGAKLELRTPPKDFEWEILNIAGLESAAEEELEAARANHQRLSSDLRDAVRKGRTGTLTRQKSAAHEELLRRERVHAAVAEMAHGLRIARAKAVALLTCPTCGTAADSARDFDPRDRGCFRCVCSSCRTAWATRLCPDGHRYATMLPSGDFVDTQDQRPGWEDRVYGCDILALPARGPYGQWGFACPECGQVS